VILRIAIYLTLGEAMATEAADVTFGRFGETAMWILVALASGPLPAPRILDEVRALDGYVGPGALFGAVARLERRGLIEPVQNRERQRAYRLSGRWLAGPVAQQEGIAP